MKYSLNPVYERKLSTIENTWVNWETWRMKNILIGKSESIEISRVSHYSHDGTEQKLERTNLNFTFARTQGWLIMNFNNSVEFSYTCLRYIVCARMWTSNKVECLINEPEFPLCFRCSLRNKLALKPQCRLEIFSYFGG